MGIACRILFTASGDSEDYIERFNIAFGRYVCDRSLLTVFRKPTPNTSLYLTSAYSVQLKDKQLVETPFEIRTL